MAESFGTVLAAELERAGMTQLVFAAKINLNQGQLSRVLAGKRRPPLEDLARWFDLLRLEQSRRERLLLLAHLAHATPWLRTHVANLYERLDHHYGRRNPRRARRIAEDSEVDPDEP